MVMFSLRCSQTAGDIIVLANQAWGAVELACDLFLSVKPLGDSDMWTFEIWTEV